MANSPRLTLPYLVAGQAQKEITHNDALNDLDSLAQISVINRTTATPPAAPTDGDSYIVAASPTGAWAGNANAVATYYSGWRIKPAKAGWVAYVQAEGIFYVFDGSAWAAQSPATSKIMAAIPSALTASYNFENASFQLYDASPYAAVATCSLTPEQVFDAYSTARSAPSVTYYVNSSIASGAWAAGSDTNNGLSRAAPYATLSKAITSINTGGVAAKVYIYAGNVVRTSGFGATSPTQDIAWIAESGRVVTGSFDAFGAPAVDATFTNTYSWARSNVNRVFDILRQDRFGKYIEMQMVGSAAICNRTPNSWYTDNVTLYVNRGDGAAVTNANTRYFLAATNSVFNGNGLTNQFFGCEDNGFSGFDFQGGGSCMTINSVSPSATRHVLVVRNSTMRYAGGRVDTGGRGVMLESFHGAAWFFSCDISHNISDGINLHNTNSAALTAMITINCSGFENGAGPNVGQQSCNAWTSHENAVGVDVAGYYENNRGGSCSSIHTSKSFFAGTYVKNDLGDGATGGTIRPTAFRTSNTAVYYCLRTKADMPSGAYAYQADTGSTIYQREAWLSRAASCGAGTITAY